MLPPAPPRFSTMTGWPRRSDSAWAMMRAVTSVLPPAAKPTNILIGVVGQAVWACAAAAVRAIANVNASENQRRIIHPPLAVGLIRPIGFVQFLGVVSSVVER